MLDLIIIGAGTAGISAYKEAKKHTQNLLIVNAGPWDTTCARVGCMPSKILISSANRLYDSQHIDEVGVKTKSSFDTSQVMAHVRALRDDFTGAVIKEVESWSSQHRISGQARFIDANTIEVNDQRYQAKAFILAVGSTPKVEPVWKDKLKERLITSDDIFELGELPDSMAVIGSGAIAIELAQAVSRLGVKTTIFARSHHLGSLTSPKLQNIAQQEISKELKIYFNTTAKQVDYINDKVQIQFENEGQLKEENFDYLLSAMGRASLLGTLQLENIDKSFKDIKKLPVNSETKQLADFPIFIAGDAYTDTPVQHEASHEGKSLVKNALDFPNIQTVKTLTPLSIVFSSPQMAIVGKSYKQLTEDKIDFITGYVSYTNQGRARTLGKNKGGVEVYIDSHTSKLLGAELIVSSAEHLAHLLNWMMTQNLKLDQFLNHAYYHPTLEEGLKTAFRDALKQLKAKQES